MQFILVIFRDKIARVKSSVESMRSKLNLSIASDILVANSNSPLDDLDYVTQEEVARLLSRLPNKSSPLDYIHTSIIKSYSDVFASLIAHLANLSFSEGCFPAEFKLA